MSKDDSLSELLPTTDDTVHWTESEVCLMRRTIKRMEAVLDAARAELRFAEQRLGAGVS